MECFLRLDPSIHHQLLASRHSGINASGTISRRFVVDADGESPGHLIGFAGCSCHATPRRGLSKSEVPELGRTNRGKHASSIQDKCSCAVWYSRSFQACIVVLSRVGNRKGPASDSLTRFETGQRITGRSSRDCVLQSDAEESAAVQSSALDHPTMPYRQDIPLHCLTEKSRALGPRKDRMWSSFRFPVYYAG